MGPREGRRQEGPCGEEPQTQMNESWRERTLHCKGRKWLCVAGGKHAHNSADRELTLYCRKLLGTCRSGARFMFFPLCWC